MIAIPVSIISTFVAIAALGLSINVISLAGLAFAVGMVVDASIVSLENIYRLSQSGTSSMKAAYWGARQVWGPHFGFGVDDGCGFYSQFEFWIYRWDSCFRDIAVAISASVLVSVFVSITVIPALASRFIKNVKPEIRLLRSRSSLIFGRGFKTLRDGLRTCRCKIECAGLNSSLWSDRGCGLRQLSR